MGSNTAESARVSSSDMQGHGGNKNDENIIDNNNDNDTIKWLWIVNSTF